MKPNVLNARLSCAPCILPLLAALSALSVSCSDSDSGSTPGTLEVSISGQSFALTGWPTEDEGETVALDDGWTVRFESVVVSVAHFSLGDRDGALTGLDADPVVIDLHRLNATTLEETIWRFEDVPAQRFDDVGYQLVPAEANSRVVGEVDSAIIDAMVPSGASMYFAGYGDLDGDSSTEDDHYRFEWLIEGSVVNTRCLNGTDETFGVIIEENQVNEAEVTFHLDHLLWDNHDADEPQLVFEAYAAASALAATARSEADDRLITMDDLAYQQLDDLRGLDGEELTLNGQRVVFRPRAGAELPDDTLRAYLLDAALSTGHFNGEGHCEYNTNF